MLHHGDISGQIVDAAIEVHRQLGPGLLESAYETCLFRELGSRGIIVQRQVILPISYKGEQLDCGYRLDLVVADLVIVELKCVSEITELHKAQLLTYLKLSGKKVGLLLNFNVPLLKQGITRIVL
jgi:GxxExxY protein